jgi:hypothetical protein
MAGHIEISDFIVKQIEILGVSRRAICGIEDQATGEMAKLRTVADNDSEDFVLEFR